MSLPKLLFLSLVCYLLNSVPSIFAEDHDPQEEELPEVEAPWSDENDAMCTCCDPPVRRGDVITDENQLQVKYMKMKPIEFSIIWLLRFFGFKIEPGHIRYSKWLKRSRILSDDDLIKKMVYDVSKQIHHKSPEEQKDDEAQDSEEEGISRNTTVLPPTVVEHTRKTATIRKRLVMPEVIYLPSEAEYKCGIENQLFEDEFDAFFVELRIMEKSNRFMCFLFCCLHEILNLVDKDGNPKRRFIAAKILVGRGIIKVMDTVLPDTYLVDNPMDKATKGLDIIEHCIQTTTVTDPVEKKNKCAYSFYVTQCIFTHNSFEEIKQYVYKVRERKEEESERQMSKKKEGASKKHEEEEGMREKERPNHEKEREERDVQVD